MLQRFASQGLTIKRILPDVLALPVSDHNSSAALIGEQWLIRHSETEGAVVDSAWLDLYLSSYLQNHAEKEKAVNGIHGLMIQVELRKYKYLIFALQDVIPRQIRIAQHDKVRVL